MTKSKECWMTSMILLLLAVVKPDSVEPWITLSVLACAGWELLRSCYYGVKSE